MPKQCENCPHIEWEAPRFGWSRRRGAFQSRTCSNCGAEARKAWVLVPPVSRTEVSDADA